MPWVFLIKCYITKGLFWYHVSLMVFCLILVSVDRDVGYD